jgi:penicillin-binding protein 1B
LQAMHLLHYAMREVVREGTGRGVYSFLKSDFESGRKDRYHQYNRDSWFAGFSGDLLAVSWIGHDDNTSTGLTGSIGALKVWAHFLAAASERSLSYRMPYGIQTHWIESETGRVTLEGCPNARLLPFITL